MMDAPGRRDVLLRRWQERAQGGRLVLAEGQDARVVEAARRLAERGLGAVILIVADSRALANAVRCSSDTLIVHHVDDLAADPRIAAVIDAAAVRRNLEPAAAVRLGRDPVAVAAAMVRGGLADAAVAGAATESAAVVRAAIRIIGRARDRSTVSGAFLLLLPDGAAVTFTDCAVVPVPTAEQLAEIAADGAALHEELTGQSARVAFLSFSTLGSAQHPSVEAVREAVDLFRRLRPSVAADGELQFDAAYVPAVAARKAPQSTVAGQANVFVFPNLDAGNLGYKIAERLGRATAVGPILLGLARPMNDLSRGCSVEDIEAVSLVSIVLSRARVAGSAGGEGACVGEVAR